MPKWVRGWGAVGCAVGACGRGGSGVRQRQLRLGSDARQEQLRCRMLSVPMRIGGGAFYVACGQLKGPQAAEEEKWVKIRY